MRSKPTRFLGTATLPSAILLLISLLLVAIPSSNGAAADDAWLREFDEAVAAANREDKDILIDFSGTDWCYPCQQLWRKILNQPEFIKLANRHFVLLDIDNLARTEMPEGFKERYNALQKRYNIHAFPTVVLANADGLPYAATGLLRNVESPSEYWQHLEPLYKRGQRFKRAFIAAGGADGFSDAKSTVDVLCEVRPDFVARFYPATLDRLRKLEPSDETGYLAFIDFRVDLLELEDKLHEAFLASYNKWLARETIEQWAGEFSPRDVDALIDRHRPQGVSLQEALLARAFLEIDAGKWSQALATIDAIATATSPESRFERANFVQIAIRSPSELHDRVVTAQQMSDDPMRQLRALHRILREDLQCMTPTSCCNKTFTLELHNTVAGDAYGKLLLSSTAHLKSEARAAAIGKGLEDIEVNSIGSIGRIVYELMPKIVGKEAAKEYLPAPYAGWLDD